MITVNGSRLDTLGYQFALRMSSDKTMTWKTYAEAKRAQRVFGGELVFRELWATQWTLATEDEQ